MNIWIAASDNDIDGVKRYISSGQHKPTDADANGYTPLHAAASYGHIELLDYLVKEVNGDINVQDLDGDTPLHTVEDEHVARHIVEQLGGDHTIKNAEGQTAFDKLLEEEEFPEVIEYLRSLAGDSLPVLSAINDADLPANTSVRLAYRSDVGSSGVGEQQDGGLEEEGGISEEQRERLRQIVESENPEEGMREFLRDAIHQQLANNGGLDGDEDDYKRRRRD